MSLDGRPHEPPTLADAGARDAITTDLGRTLFVEAGAGSGKTSSLVDRIVALVAGGVRIEQIAAITFTEAAAAELRHRVRDALLDRLAEQARRSNGDVRLAHLVEASESIETAPITTLHGFALRLLMQHPVEAGLPPGFEIVDEINSILDFDDAWRVFVGRVGDDLELLDLQARASVLKLELKNFPEIARRFDDNWDRLVGVDLTPPPLSPLDFSDVFRRIEEVCALADTCTDADDKLAVGLEKLAADGRRLEAQEPLDQVEGISGIWPKRGIGRKGSWPSPSVTDVREQVESLRAHVEARLGALTDEVLRHFAFLVADFVAARAVDRQAEGRLSFHDLLVLARRLLRSNEEVRSRLHHQYTHLLLDEFQDTDPIQIELAVLLASSEPVRDQRWEELAPRLPAGRVVVVGDPKQSIYRFRRADMEVYASAERGLSSEPVQLTTNFRSLPGVVEFVNHVFGEVMADGVPGQQPAYTPLVAHREPPASDTHDEARPPVVVIGGPSDDNAADIRQREAADIAGLVCQLMEDEEPVFRDGAWLPARLQDIAVLIPSRLSLPALESAFSGAGLPFRPETSSLVYSTQEVRDVLAGVRAVVDPSSSVDVVAALRSALFAVSDNDLLQWSLAGGSWDYRQAAPENVGSDPVVAEAFTVLRTWHDERWWSEPAAFVDRIVRERRLREQSLAAARPRDRWRRYRFLVEQARQFASSGGGDLHDFVRWVEIQSSDLARVTEPIPAEPDDDAIRVLTVHGSKGLEFPITVLAGASTQESNRMGGASVIFTNDGRPEVKLGRDRATTDFDVHASVEEVLDGFERARLQYVAATRARDLLVVSAHHRSRRQSMGKRVFEQLEKRPDLWRRFEASGDERYEAQPPTQLRLAAGGFTDEVDRWRGEQQRLLTIDRRARVESATSVAVRVADAAEVGSDPSVHLVGHEPDAERRPWRRGRAGTAIGSAVHAVLQHVDLEQGDGLDGLARLHAEREGVGHLATQVADLARVALDAPSVREAVTGRFWRELHVAVPTGDQGGLLEGYIDLLLETENGLIVADFKTDSIDSPQAADRLARGYRLQGASYALAVQQITGRPVVECRFVFLSRDGVIERSMPDLPEAMAEVTSALT